MHQRQVIREAVIDLLLDNTAVGSNVTTNITRPTWRESLPEIVVYTGPEDIEIFNTAPRRIKRTLSLVIEISATLPATEDLENADLQTVLDDLVEEVENIMAVDHTLTGACSDHVMRGMEPDYTQDGDQPIGSMRLMYDVIYVTDVPNSSTDQTDIANITDFSGSDIEYDIGHHDESPDGQVDAEDVADN